MNSDLFKLAPNEFDSSEAGWRALAAQGSDLEAAELILRYVTERGDDIQAAGSPSLATFYFHAGQEYACAGKEHYPDAIIQMRKAHKDDLDWNTYVNGTIGFLMGDAAVVSSAIHELNTASPELVQTLKKLQAGLQKSQLYREAYDS